MSTDRARHAFAPFCHRRPATARLGAGFAVGVACAFAVAASPAAANPKLKEKLGHEKAEHVVSKEPFGNIPKGPLQLIISIDEQKLHLYSNGTEVADALVATGVSAHPTPMGVFSVIEKARYHRSNIYSGAPMPWMQRITWSGVAIHEGVGVGHRASHGCIRIPHDFAERLWDLTRLGARVIIARPKLRPEAFVDSHLFVHRPMPTAPAPIVAPPPAPPAAETSKTAQTSVTGETLDTVASPAPLAFSGGNALADKAADPRPATSQESKDAADVPAVGDALKAAATDVKPETDAAVGERTRVDPVDPPAPTTVVAAPVAALETVPMPLAKPAELARSKPHVPIAIFVSRKAKRIYVRQQFSPLFDAPISIEHAERPLGTHVFTALEYLADGSTFRWNVVSFPGEQPKAARQPAYEKRLGKYAKPQRREEHIAEPLFDPPPETPQEALARIAIPQDVIDQISALIVPGSSLIVSDQGLGEETGEGTGFIVVTRGDERLAAEEERQATRSRRRAEDAGLGQPRGYRLPQPFWPFLMR